METILLRGFGPPRPEAADLCGDRLVTWVEAIGRIQPLYSAWYRTGYKPGPRYLLDAAGLRQRLALGRNRRDTDRTVIEDLGYSIDAHNAVRGQSASVLVKCGSYSPGLTNRALVEATVLSWHPDWAEFTTGRLLGEASTKRGGSPT